MIWKHVLPPGVRYRFWGFSDRELKFMGNWMPKLLHINRRMRQEAMLIWLQQNRFSLIAQPNDPANLVDLGRGFPTGSFDPRGSDIAANVRWIASMVNYTHRINVTLECRGRMWRLFPQFFTIVQLLHRYEIPVTVNGTRPSSHPTGVHRAYGIRITFETSKKPQAILLKLLGFAREARASNMPPDQLKVQFDALLKREKCTAAIAVEKPAVFRNVEQLHLPSGITAYLGPNDLLHETLQGAAKARDAVNSFAQPSTEKLSRPWIRALINSLRSWRHTIQLHLDRLNLRENASLLCTAIL